MYVDPEELKLETLLQHFSNHLDHEFKFLVTYLDTLQKQTLAVVDGNTQGILQETNDLNDMMQQNQHIQETRQHLLGQLANHFSFEDSHVTISTLLPHVDTIWADKLTAQKDRLLNLVQKIQWETESNSYLLRYAIDFTHSIIQLSDTTIKSQLGYSKSGSKSLNASPTKLLDHKA